MSKSREYLKSLGMTWRNDRGFVEMYEAVPPNLMKKLMMADKTKTDRAAHEMRFDVLMKIFGEERSLVINDVNQLKTHIALDSQLNRVPDKMIQDIEFVFNYRTKPYISAAFTRLYMDEYFEHDKEKKIAFYETLVPDYARIEKMDTRVAHLKLGKKLEELTEFITDRIDESGINNKLKYRMLELMVEDYQEGLKRKGKEKQLEKTSLVGFIKKMATSL